MKVGDTVKYAHPQPGEEDLRFILLEHNGDRVAIQLICDWRIKPVETVDLREVVNALVQHPYSRGDDWLVTSLRGIVQRLAA